MNQLCFVQEKLNILMASFFCNKSQANFLLFLELREKFVLLARNPCFNKLIFSPIIGQSMILKECNTVNRTTNLSA